MKSILLFFIVLLQISAGQAAETLLDFSSADNHVVTVNGYPLLPIEPQRKVFEAVTLNTRGFNTIEVDGVQKRFRLFRIKPGDILKFSVNGEIYQLNLFPRKLPVPDIAEYTGGGYIATSFFSPKGDAQSFATIMTTDGTIEFYHTNPIKNYGISDFKRQKLTDGSIRYTFMQQTKPMPPYAWWYGKLIVLDENFQKINELSLIAPTADEGLIENHDSLLLTDNHYILTGYRQRKERINGRESSVVTLLLQEIKNNRVIFEWNSGDHPELIKESLTACNYKKDLDYVHFNSMIIDPSDNNLILSFRHTSAICKIDRKTGEIIWRLGGKNDDFGLTPEQRFNFQHTASLTNDGYLMLYDNHTAEINTECAGNFSFLPRKTSRILKFKLDEKNKKILNWQEIPLSVYSEFMGNVFETEDKTYIVGYGSNKGKAAEELDKDGTPLWTFKLPDNLFTYRVYKYR